ncbi:lysophospholipid acyltransferase family protein [Planctomicrobium sp. SH661]|uniref:lysophospholipid acyltransferase family protein n=1 Tax=Planctomicrobium sp. SH661 TaxID=3448124 RepID=UPI003F5B7AD8
MTLEQARWRAEYIGFRLFACVVEMLSPRQIARLANFLAWVMMTIVPRKWSRYDLARENLTHAFGEEYSPAQIDELIRRMWVHLFRMVGEIIQFPRKLRLENCRDVMVFRNRRASVKAINSGRPIFMVGGHFGNWEASTATFGVFGFQMGIVARKLDNPYLQKWFQASREQTGHQLLLKNGGWDGMAEILQARGNLGLLCDQDAGKRGVFVNFLGRPASTFRSIALMALEAKALIVVGYGRRVMDDFNEARWSRFEIGCEEVIDVAEIQADDEVHEVTRRFTNALERAVRRSPEQYFWVHRRWKSVPRQAGASRSKKAG